MADVTLTYKGATIAELDDSGSKTIRTAGKFCEADIGVEYAKPSGGYSVQQIFDREIAGDITVLLKTNNSKYVFQYCPGITSITFSQSNTSTALIPDFGCSGCTGLLSAKCVPPAALVAHQLGTNCFQSCTNLQIACFPLATNVYTAVFNGCSKLEIVELGDANFLRQSAFNGCAKLRTLILRGTTVAPLSNVNNFAGTPFASGGAGGTIYIHKALYDHLGDGSSLDYKAATNWSTIDGYGTITWAAIEGSIYETQYADGTPIPTE